MSNTFFVYLSLLLQIFARILSIGLYFFAVRDFIPAVPIFLSIHFAAVFVIKVRLILAKTVVPFHLML